MTTSFLPSGRRGGNARRAAAAPATPAQRVILALGLPVVLTIAAWSGYGIVSVIGRSSYTATASAAVAGGHFTLNAGDSDGVTVEGGAATGSVQATATVTYDLTRPDIRPTLTASSGPGGTSAGIACPASNCNVVASASVPSATALTLTGNGSEMTVGGITAPVSADTGGGSLILNSVTGDLDLNTEGGSVDGTALSAPDLSVNTDPGGFGGVGGGGPVDLMLTTVPKDLQVNSAGANVTLQLPPNAAGYRLQLDGGCGDGNGAVSAAPASGGSAPSSWCGDVDSSVPSDPSSPDVIVVSSAGGEITIT
jgi:hypothetical protein